MNTDWFPSHKILMLSTLNSCWVKLALTAAPQLHYDFIAFIFSWVKLKKGQFWDCEMWFHKRSKKINWRWEIPSKVFESSLFLFRDKGVSPLSQKTDVNASCRSIPDFLAGSVTRAFVSIDISSLTDTDFWREMGSTCLEEAGESLLADWLTIYFSLN